MVFSSYRAIGPVDRLSGVISAEDLAARRSVDREKIEWKREGKRRQPAETGRGEKTAMRSLVRVIKRLSD